MPLQIIENHRESVVNVKGIIDRIIKYLPTDILDGLNEIVLLNTNEEHEAFGCYKRGEGRIELYIEDIIGWLPWLLKKTYIFPYLFLGMALGHEMDHHVNRNNDDVDKEISAEKNSMKYIIPSMGIFKPIVRIIPKIHNRKWGSNL